MKLKHFLAVSAVALLVACGGGSSSLNNEQIIATGSSETATFYTQKVFDDGSGLILAEVTNGSRALIFTNDASYVTSAGSQSIRDTWAETVSQGEFVRISYDDQSMYNFGFAISGPSLTNFPIGNQTYSGGIISHLRGASVDQNGNFTLNAAFGGNTFEFVGEIQTGSIGAQGAIDPFTGEFFSTDANIATDFGEINIDLRGQFYGEGARSVGGVFYSNEDVPGIVGGFAGI